MSELPLSPLEYLLAALAAYRAARLLALDKLTEEGRAIVDRWAHRGPRGGRTREARPWRGKLATLLSCGFCNGYWLSGAAYLALVLPLGRWHDAPLLVHGVSWWAVAGAEALAIRYDAGKP